MKKLLCFAIFLISIPAWSQLYFGADAGFGRYRTDSLDTINASPSGINYDAIFGYKYSFASAELFYGMFKADEKITHSGVQYYYHMDDQFYGASAKLYFLFIYFRLGYAYHSYKKYVYDFAEDKTLQSGGVADYYIATNETNRTSGVMFGLGGEGEIVPWLSAYVDMSRYSVSSSVEDIFLFSVGLKFNIPGTN